MHRRLPVNPNVASPVARRLAAGALAFVLGLAATTCRIADLVKPDRPGTLRSRMVDCTKARQLLGFVPLISVEQGLRETVGGARPLGLVGAAVGGEKASEAARDGGGSAAAPPHTPQPAAKWAARGVASVVEG